MDELWLWLTFTKPCYWCWWDCYLSLIKELMWNPGGWYQNKLFHPREKFCKKTRALMSGEKERERGELNCLSWETLSGERREGQWGTQLGKLTALLWALFTNECNVTSRQGTTLSLVLEGRARPHYYLFSFSKLDVRNLKSFMLDVRHPQKLSDRKHIFSK